MKNLKLAALLGIVALMAAAAASFAAETGAPGAPKAPARLASARPAPAPASARPAPAPILPGLIGERPCVPAERMADCIAEFYASGRLRIY